MKTASPIHRSARAALRNAIRTKTARIGIIGLGYVGLPLAESFVLSGFKTIGLDSDGDKIATLLQGRGYLGHLDPHWITESVNDDSFLPTQDMRHLEVCDVIFICVPTPLTTTGDPDLSYVIKAVQSVASTLRAGQLVVLESTTYPGTTRDLVLPLLQRSGLLLGSDYFLAYSPEREDPGNTRFATTDIPRVVGALDTRSRQMTVELFRAIGIIPIPVSSSEVAEAAKMLENIYRAVNIALVNELKCILNKMDIDIWEVIQAAKSKPFGFQPFYPGPGLGGHCIPVDPVYLSWAARQTGTVARLIELSVEINSAMPTYVVDKVEQALCNRGKLLQGSLICVLGVAYKKDVGDTRESPSLAILNDLHERGALVSYNDPHIPSVLLTGTQGPLIAQSQDINAGFLSRQDCVIIATDHSYYEFEQIVQHVALVVDTRNAIKGTLDGRLLRA